MELTSKERVLTALQHKEPDRVPVFAYFTPEIRAKLAHYLGMNIKFRGGPWGDAEAEVELEGTCYVRSDEKTWCLSKYTRRLLWL